MRSTGLHFASESTPSTGTARRSSEFRRPRRIKNLHLIIVHLSEINDARVQCAILSYDAMATKLSGEVMMQWPRPREINASDFPRNRH